MSEPRRTGNIDHDPVHGTSQQYALRHTWGQPGAEQEEYFGPWWRDYTVERSRGRRALNSPQNHKWEVVTLQHTDIIDKNMRPEQAGHWTIPLVQHGKVVALEIELNSKYAHSEGVA